MRFNNRLRPGLAWVSITAILVGFWCVFGTSYDRLVFVNTLGLGLLSGFISIPLGWALANSASRNTSFGRLTLLACLSLAMVPVVFQVSCWDSAFGKLGWMTAKWTGTNQPILTSWTATIWIHAASLTPQIAILFLVAIFSGRRIHEEQASIDAGKSQVFWHVILPRYLPVIAMAFCWSFVCCSREIAVTDIYQVGTIAEQIYLGFALGQFDSVLGTGSAKALATDNVLSLGLQVTTIIWLVFTGAYFVFSIIGQEKQASNFRPPIRNQPQSIWGILVSTLVLLALVGVPVVNLLTRASFHIARVDGKPVGSHSVEYFVTALRRATTDYLPQTNWSFLIAGGCVALTMPLAICFAWLVIRRRALQLPIVLLLAIGLALPGPVIGTGLLKIYTWIDAAWIDFLFNRTIAPVVFAATVVTLPITTLLLWFLFSTTAEDAQEHLMTEGASSFRASWQTFVVGNLRSIMGVAILCFILAYGDLSATQMVLPPGVESVPRLTLGLMHAGVNKMTAALTIVNVSSILCISLLAWKLVRLKWSVRTQQ